MVYYDGQFDDSRLLIHLDRQTAADHGATLLELRPRRRSAHQGTRPAIVTGLVIAEDSESLVSTSPYKPKVVVNAAGIFADEIRQPPADVQAKRMLSPEPGNPSRL